MKKNFLISTLIVLSVFTVSCGQKQQQQARQKMQQPIGGVESSYYKDGDIKKIKVTADQANVRAGCSGDAPVVQTPNKDKTFDVVNQVADWFAVKLPDNKIGFIPKDQCKAIVSSDKKAQVSQENAGAAPQGTTSPGTTTPKTPTAQTNSTSLTDAEQQMLKLVNDARAQNNLPALKVDMQLCNVARIKSQDMIDNNYFSHSSPKYGSPFDMMKSFGVNFVQAGENIAGNQNVQNAENALMNSPGHRKNILSPDFTHIGIGIKSGGPYGMMFTQEFISKPQ